MNTRHFHFLLYSAILSLSTLSACSAKKSSDSSSPSPTPKVQKPQPAQPVNPTPNTNSTNKTPTNSTVISEEDRDRTLKSVIGKEIVVRLRSQGDAGCRWLFVSNVIGTPVTTREPATIDPGQEQSAPGDFGWEVFTWKTDQLETMTYEISLISTRFDGSSCARFNVKVALSNY